MLCAAKWKQPQLSQMNNESGSKKIESEEHRLVVRIFTDDLGFDQTAALDQIDDTCELTEFALEIETVVLCCHQYDVAFALVERLNESLDINVVHAECFCHNKNLLNALILWHVDLNLQVACYLVLCFYYTLKLPVFKCFQP